MTAVGLLGPRRTMRVVERNVRSYARVWPAFISGDLARAAEIRLVNMGIRLLRGMGEALGAADLSG